MTTKLEKLGYKGHRYREYQLTYMAIGNALICPLCLEKRTKWHTSHLVQWCDGGKDTKFNLTLICALCHRTIHDGEDGEADVMWHKLNMFMLGQYGILGRKEMLKSIIQKMQIQITVKNVREIHKWCKRVGSDSYVCSFAPNTACTGLASPVQADRNLAQPASQ